MGLELLLVWKSMSTFSTASGLLWSLLLTLAHWCMRNPLGIWFLQSEWLKCYAFSPADWQCDYWGRWSRGCDHQMSQELDPGHPAPLSLECVFWSQREPFSRIQAWESKEFLRPSSWCTWLNAASEGLCINFWASVRRVQRSTPSCGCLRQASHVSVPPYLLNLPPTKLERPAFFFSLSLSSPIPLPHDMYRGQFVNQQWLMVKCSNLFKSWIRAWNE